MKKLVDKLVLSLLSDSGKLSGVYVDLWALGVTLFAFLSGTVPWNDITSIGILSKIMTQPLDFSSM